MRWSFPSIGRIEGARLMKNPSHPGSLIKSDIDELGLTVVEAAAGLGISRQQLHRVIAGRAGVTPEMAVRLEKALGSTADTWLRMQMNYDLAQIRARASSIKVKRLAPALTARQPPAPSIPHTSSPPPPC